MSNEDGTVVAVCNGEIYNAPELRRELEDQGHRFRSRSDVEVIVHLFEEHGPELVDRLDGMWSFVVHDVAGRRLIGARDRLGKKPLYYTHTATRFAFASEPKALLALPDVSRRPRVDILPAYLAFNCVPGPATLHRDIDKLAPGTRFEVSSEHGLRHTRFWMPGPTGAPAPDADPARAVGASLERAVAKRTMADVRIGAALSGGVDSSLVTALMTDALGKGVPTFTIGYPDDASRANSDLDHARVVAERFHTEHHELILGPRELATVVDEDVPAMADDPVGAPSQAALAYLARRAREAGVTVLQVGEGADEAFAGYSDAHRLCRLHARLSRFAPFLPPSLAGGVAHALATVRAVIPTGVPLVEPFAEALRRYANRELVYWGHGTGLMRPDQARLFKTKSGHGDPYESLRARVDAIPDFHGRPYPDRVAIVDMILELPERLLMRLDRATMQHGVEARAPYLDPDVLAAAFRVPATVRAASRKGVLRTYAGHKLPATTLARSKRGFPVSAGVFTAPDVLARMRERLLARPFLDLAGFAPDAVRGMIDACARGHGGIGRVWPLYTLSVWAHHWA